MTAIDTNVLVRILTHDDPAQTEKALSILESGAVYVPVTVVLECEWVLRHAYSLDRHQVNRIFRQLADSPGVVLGESDAVAAAIALHGAGSDFADALHLFLSQRRGNRFCTFDKAFARRAAKNSPIPVVLL